MKKFFALIAALFWLGGASAWAQDADHTWATPGGSVVTGGMGMCLNAAGKAIPIGPNCTGTTPVSGAVSVSGSNVGGYDAGTAVTPTLAVSAHAASVSAGGLQTITIHRGTAQPSGWLSHLWIASKGGATVTFTGYIFDTNPTGSICTDNSAFSLAAGDIGKLVDIVSLTPSAPQGSTATFASQEFPRANKNGDGTVTQNLYVCWVVGASYTPASSSDLVFKLFEAQD